MSGFDPEYAHTPRLRKVCAMTCRGIEPRTRTIVPAATSPDLWGFPPRRPQLAPPRRPSPCVLRVGPRLEKPVPTLRPHLSLPVYRPFRRFFATVGDGAPHTAGSVTFQCRWHCRRTPVRRLRTTRSAWHLRSAQPHAPSFVRQHGAPRFTCRGHTPAHRCRGQSELYRALLRVRHRRPRESLNPPFSRWGADLSTHKQLGVRGQRPRLSCLPACQQLAQ